MKGRLIMTSGQSPVRIGVLGAARVVPCGLVQPAAAVPGVQVRAIASRTLARAQALAAKLQIPLARGAYEQVLDDPDIDAIYVALPPARHAPWVRKALDAGKHVLCEKPLTPTAAVAEELVRHASARGLVLQEAMHVQFLRTLRRQRDLVASGALGRLLHVDSCCRFPHVPFIAGDFRLRAELGGGARLDLGGYAVTCLRIVSGEEPEVVSVQHRSDTPDVDSWMKATLRLPSGAAAVAECGFKGAYQPRFGVTVRGERGEIAWDPAGLACTIDGRVTKEAIPAGWTYRFQLEAFAKRVRGETSDARPPEDAVATARVLDAMYEHAGLTRRDAMVDA